MYNRISKFDFHYTILTSVTLASMNNALPKDGAAAPKHVTAILMYILILFLRQSLVHLLVNKKLL